MIGLDTNILVRYLTEDDVRQHRAVVDLISDENKTFFVSDLVLLETFWVLASAYKWRDSDAADAFLKLLRISNFVFEDDLRLRLAIRATLAGGGFEDELIVAKYRRNDCGSMATFDKLLIKNHRGFAKAPASF